MLSDDEDSMELMYPKQDATVVCVNLMLLLNVDWLQFSVCRGCCRPSNAVSKGMAGATALASPKGEGSYIFSLVKTSIELTLCRWWKDYVMPYPAWCA